MDYFLKVFLVLYILIYILIPYFYSVFIFIRKYNFDPRVTDRRDDIMYIFQVYRNILFVTLAVTVVMYSFAPSVYAYLVPISFLESYTLQVFGVAVLTGSLLLVRLSQSQLKSSWRIGMDHTGRKGPLITTGIYHFSRNPIALGMTLTTLGFFLVLPNAITFAVLQVTILIFVLRVRMEEQHMEHLYGKEYVEYKKNTPRWL